MTSTSDSVSCGLPKNGESNVVFSGTVGELRKRLYTVPLDYNPHGRLPIDLLQVGDYSVYNKYYNRPAKTFIIEEVHPHGGDENKRVVVAREIAPAAGTEQHRTVFDAQYLPGEKMIDLFTPQIVRKPWSVFKVVAGRQFINAQGGYKR